MEIYNIYECLALFRTAAVLTLLIVRFMLCYGIFTFLKIVNSDGMF